MLIKFRKCTFQERHIFVSNLYMYFAIYFEVVAVYLNFKKKLLRKRSGLDYCMERKLSFLQLTTCAVIERWLIIRGFINWNTSVHLSFFTNKENLK